MLKKSLFVAFVAVSLMGLTACKCCDGKKLAVVDVQKVVTAYPEVQKLRLEQEKNTAELAEWIKGPNEEIEKIKDKDKKAELANKYATELNQKKQALQLEYVQKLQQIDAKITEIIKSVADKKGFKMVFTKNSLVVGGTDITEEVIQELVK
ncbi:MAG: OmpH family outer membrane protein [Alphaproteobacteria bacterium]|nr:OmpH family outer membrane protein [Alphaproteobacteria bacterium]